MTKAELLKEFDKLQKEKEIRIEGIHCNSNKSTIENAIECLKCPDELLEKYLTVVSLKYENIGRTIAENGDFKRHSFNRLYVFNTARQILANQGGHNMRDFIELLKAFGLFVSCLVIGYGGLFLFFY